VDLENQLNLGHLLLLERKCRVCEVDKNLTSDYYLVRKDPTLPSSYSYECKECTVKRTADYNRKNAYGVRSRYLKRNYGITLEDYEERIAQQNYSCAICKATEAGGKFNKRFMIDCDSSGSVRGLLCTNCRNALKLVGDNIHTLQKMINYLQTSGEYDHERD
tara:strand:- start:161 stop:646 length:486 start_codon:yes stop_codon:yes gene_type:complete